MNPSARTASPATITFAELLERVKTRDGRRFSIEGEIAGIGSGGTGFDLVDIRGELSKDIRSVPVVCRPGQLRDLSEGRTVVVRGVLRVRKRDVATFISAAEVAAVPGAGRVSPSDLRRRAQRDPRTSPEARERLDARTGPPRALPVAMPVGRELRVTFIGPSSALARRDIQAGLRPGRLRSSWVSVSFHDASAIADAVSAVDPAEDLVVLYRGGGGWRDWLPLGDVRVLNAVAGSAVPVATAIGHTDTHAAVSVVSDADLPTPTEVRKALNALTFEPPTPRTPRTATTAHPGRVLSVADGEPLGGVCGVDADTEPSMEVADATADTDLLEDARRRLVEIAEEFALHRIRVRGACEGGTAIAMSAAVGAVPAVLAPQLPPTLTTAIALLSVAGGIRLAVPLLCSGSRALQRPRRIPPGTPEAGTDEWLEALGRATTPRAYRWLHP